jgi:dihydroorotase
VRAFSDDGDPVGNSGLFFRILKALSSFRDVLVIAHSEERTLSGGGVCHAGAWSKKLGLPGIPAAAETVAVARDILLAREAGARLHLAHLSSAGSVELLEWARRQGLPVTAEVTPHHLLLTEAAVETRGAAAKVNPPLRTENDRLALCQALRAGLIDIIATDHAPHTAAEKERGMAVAPFGITGLETAVPLLLTGLVRVGLLSLADLVQAFSCRPAQLLGLPAGTLRPGAPADLVLLDLEAKGAVDPKRFYSRGGHSPFAGRPLKGLPVMTMVGGEIKMDKGVVLFGK